MYVIQWEVRLHGDSFFEHLGLRFAEGLEMVEVKGPFSLAITLNTSEQDLKIQKKTGSNKIIPNSSHDDKHYKTTAQDQREYPKED